MLFGRRLDESVTWYIETIYEAYSDYWTNKRIYSEGNWYIEHRRVACNQPVIDKQGDLNKVRESLEINLGIVQQFAQEQYMKDFAAYFKHMKELLYTSNPQEPVFHKDLIVKDNYSILAKQVLFTAISSWCLTGMGSWGDISIFSIKGQEKKNLLTAELFRSVCDAIVVSVNSY